MKFKPLPSQERILELLKWKDFNSPDPPVWLSDRSSCIKAGEPAGCINKTDGYYQIVINGICYKEHRLRYKAFYGCDPEEIDHKDQNKLNNSISNLRQASPQQNKRNIPLRKNNTSGCSGVYWRGKRNKWEVMFQDEHSKMKFYGLYTDYDDAVEIASIESYRVRKVIGV